MSELFDDVTRAVAAPISRREALRLIAGTVGAVLISRFFRAPLPAIAGECDPEADPMYPHLCADICCRYDYYCASTTLLNGAETHGVCCYESGTHLCSAGGYGWCCEDAEACGNEPFTCVCGTGGEPCGRACCNTAAGEFCCDPNQDLCCTDGVECCYDADDEGTCCPEGTKCVVPSTYPYPYPDGRVCCPVDRACRGQCCPDGELCIFELACCPADRTTSDRLGCCPSGFKYMASGGCCMDGLYCGGDVCCTKIGEVCRDGTCQGCPSDQMKCFDKCCPTGTCCFGNCCGDGQTCTGECTTLETITGTVNPQTGGELASSDGGVTISFLPLGTEETVQYTSQAQPGHPLREGDQLLRSFRLISPAAGSRPEQGQMVFYTIHVRYTEATLAAMGVESEFQLQLLWWDASSSAWAPAFYPEIDRAAEEVVVTQALLGEFALVAGAEVEDSSGTVYLPLVSK